MKDIQILLELYKEQRDLGIHHEGQRSTVSGLMLTVATILIGLIALDNKLTWIDLPLALVIVFLGIFGALFDPKLNKLSKKKKQSNGGYIPFMMRGGQNNGRLYDHWHSRLVQQAAP